MAAQFLPQSPQIAVFGRLPRPGAGKTRLARGVGPQRAAELERAFLLDAIERAVGLAPEGAWFHVAPEPGEPAARTLAAARELVGDAVRIALQEGPHLGARMHHALAALSARTSVQSRRTCRTCRRRECPGSTWLATPAEAATRAGTGGRWRFVLIRADRARRDARQSTVGTARFARARSAAYTAWQVLELEPCGTSTSRRTWLHSPPDKGAAGSDAAAGRAARRAPSAFPRRGRRGSIGGWAAARRPCRHHATVGARPSADAPALPGGALLDTRDHLVITFTISPGPPTSRARRCRFASSGRPS
jgi:hypothetical protein